MLRLGRNPEPLYYCGRKIHAMGKRSTREHKNAYQLAREDAGMTREEASEALQFISDSRNNQMCKTPESKGVKMVSTII